MNIPNTPFTRAFLRLRYPLLVVISGGALLLNPYQEEAAAFDKKESLSADIEKLTAEVPRVSESAVKSAARLPPIRTEEKPLSPRSPALSVTVAADSGLSAHQMDILATEARRFSGIDVRIVFQGLPMKETETGRLRADRLEAGKRLAPLWSAGVPVTVDPTFVRRLQAGVSAAAENDGSLTFTKPAVLLSVESAGEERHEVVIGTVSIERAIREVAFRSPSRSMRRDIARALSASGHAARLDLDRSEKRLSAAGGDE